MREIEVVYQLLIGRGFLQRMEVDAVKVLDDGLLERESIVDVVLDEHRHTSSSAMPPPATGARLR